MSNTKIDLTRSFSEGRKWRLWNGPRLDAVIPGAVLYYDDPSVTTGGVQWYGGIEVHKLVLVAAVYGRMGEARVLGPIYREDTTPQGLEALRGNLASFKVKRYLMETSGIFHIPAAWHFQEWFPGAQIIVINSTDLSYYVRGTRKNDLVDATKIAQVASFDELIKPSYVPNRSQYILREMTRYRNRLGWEVTRQKNRVKKVMAALGLPWGINLNSEAQCRCLVSFLQQSQGFGDFVRAWPGRLGNKVRDQIAPWGTVVLGEAGRQILLSLLRDLAVMAEHEKLAEGRVETLSRFLPTLSRFRVISRRSLKYGTISSNLRRVPILCFTSIFIWNNKSPQNYPKQNYS